MNKKNFKNLYIGVCLITSFIIWTILISFVDLQPIGPNNSTVGFATLNGFVHNLTGVNMQLYIITDWLGLVPIAIAFGFAVLGLVQLIKRKNILKVDYNILALGVFYIIVIVLYLLFETVVINHRPVLINGYLEVSYPSSTTLLVLCVMSTAIMQFNIRIKKNKVKYYVNSLIFIFICFMVLGRVISGVHWITDIIGGILLSAGVVMLYRFAVGISIKT